MLETVSFVNVESGKDLILSFAVMKPDDPMEIDSLILLRTPIYEPLFDAAERGVRVSFERYVSDEDDLLEEVHWDQDKGVVQLKTQLHEYELDLRKVSAKSIRAMLKLLKKMNYDSSFLLSDV